MRRTTDVAPKPGPLEAGLFLSGMVYRRVAFLGSYLTRETNKALAQDRNGFFKYLFPLDKLDCDRVAGANLRGLTNQPAAAPA